MCRCLGAVFTALLFSSSGWAADASELNGIGALQKARGGAGVASPQDASWSLLNPASIVDLDRRIDSYIDFIVFTSEAEPRGFPLVTNPFAGELSDTNFIQAPAIGIIWPLKHGTLGLGVYGTQGTAGDYARPRTTVAILGNGDRRSEQQIVRIPLSYGYKFDNGWAVGASVVPIVTRLRTDSLTLRLREAKGNNDWDLALGIGFQLGLYRRWDKWSVGGTYSTRGWMQDYDKYKDDIITQNLDMPQKVQIGLAWRPVPKIEFVADYKWIGWNGTNLFEHKSVQGGLGWKNQHIVKVGAQWDINTRFSLMAGGSYGKSPIEGEDVFINALTPALSEWHATAGFTWNVNDEHALTLALVHVLPESKTENGRGDIFSFLAKGTKARYREDSVTIQYAWKF